MSSRHRTRRRFAAEQSVQLLEPALAHHRAGRLAEAEQIYQQILARQPDHDSALHLLGVIARDKGELGKAVELIRRAISVNPTVAGYHLNLGNTLRDQEAYGEAIAAYRQALRLDSRFALAYCNLANTLLKMEEPANVDEAIALARQALQLQPNYAEAFNQLGIGLRKKGNLEESVAALRRAVELSPAYSEAHNNLANALKFLGRFEEAIAAYQQAIVYKSDFVMAHYNLATTLLLLGDFERGWPEYEWRLRDPTKPRPDSFPQPRWAGEPLPEKTILLSAEQGLGDVIQFVRYAPLVVARVRKVVVRCHAQLMRLLRSNTALGQIITFDQPILPFDVHYPLLSLPLLLGTRLETIPASVPYLYPEPQLLEKWRTRLGPSDNRLSVGLRWAGNPRFRDDLPRSLTLDKLAPLAEAPRVRFYSLQRDSAADQAKHPPPGMDLIDLGPELDDFADTAAVASLMDLIITTDTSVAHLVGALARPTWLMLQFVPDYRWFLEREDSPWYPTMRLFRQPQPNDWKTVIARVAQELKNFSAART